MSRSSPAPHPSPEAQLEAQIIEADQEHQTSLEAANAAAQQKQQAEQAAQKSELRRHELASEAAAVSVNAVVTIVNSIGSTRKGRAGTAAQVYSPVSPEMEHSLNSGRHETRNEATPLYKKLLFYKKDSLGHGQQTERVSRGLSSGAEHHAAKPRLIGRFAQMKRNTVADDPHADALWDRLDSDEGSHRSSSHTKHDIAHGGSKADKAKLHINTAAEAVAITANFVAENLDYALGITDKDSYLKSAYNTNAANLSNHAVSGDQKMQAVYKIENSKRIKVARKEEDDRVRKGEFVLRADNADIEIPASEKPDIAKARLDGEDAKLAKAGQDAYDMAFGRPSGERARALRQERDTNNAKLDGSFTTDNYNNTVQTADGLRNITNRHNPLFPFRRSLNGWSVQKASELKQAQHDFYQAKTAFNIARADASTDPTELARLRDELSSAWTNVRTVEGDSVIKLYEVKEKLAEEEAKDSSAHNAHIKTHLKLRVQQADEKIQLINEKRQEIETTEARNKRLSIMLGETPISNEERQHYHARFLNIAKRQLVVTVMRGALAATQTNEGVRMQLDRVTQEVATTQSQLDAIGPKHKDSLAVRNELGRLQARRDSLVNKLRGSANVNDELYTAEREHLPIVFYSATQNAEANRSRYLGENENKKAHEQRAVEQGDIADKAKEAAEAAITKADDLRRKRKP